MELTHFDQAGNAIMVDVSEKEVSSRTAVARGEIKVCRDIMEAVEMGSAKKGDVLGVARVAGIMAAKKTSELIPLCHCLPLTKVTVDFELNRDNGEIAAICSVSTLGRTGVEMEALTAVSVSLLTIYDMCKAIDKKMSIGNIRLVSKQGGKSGDFYYEQEADCSGGQRD